MILCCDLGSGNCKMTRIISNFGSLNTLWESEIHSISGQFGDLLGKAASFLNFSFFPCKV